MDGDRFDHRTRRLTQVLSRRTGLARIGAGLVALLGSATTPPSAESAPVAGQRCLRHGKRCTRGKRSRKHRCCGAAKCRRGKCRCSSAQKVCRGKCISKTKCCSNKDCGGGGAVCRQGRCRCPQGQRDCQGTCIPASACCGNAECGACESCVDGQCVSGCQDGQACVGETCRCTPSSCPGCCDGDACRPGDRDGACGIGGEVCTQCGAHADCVAGACQCDPGFHDCAGTCQECCGNGDCGPDQVCAAGECRCARGFQPCQDGCIPEDACCGGCPPDEVCFAGTCEAPVCGNGGPCTVFVREASVRGDQIGGLAAADALCQASATRAGSLAPPGTYQAWLSNAHVGPATRFQLHSPGPYVLVDGTEVAANWDDLTDGTLAAPIDRTEDGTGISAPILTNTTPEGLPLRTDGSGSCGNWNDSLNLAWVGISLFASETWTDNGPYGCTDSVAFLYCFQQD